MKASGNSAAEPGAPINPHVRTPTPINHEQVLSRAGREREPRVRGPQAKDATPKTFGASGRKGRGWDPGLWFCEPHLFMGRLWVGPIDRTIYWPSSVLSVSSC